VVKLGELGKAIERVVWVRTVFPGVDPKDVSLCSWPSVGRIETMDAREKANL
jgi:hypothetical protein